MIAEIIGGFMGAFMFFSFGILGLYCIEWRYFGFDELMGLICFSILGACGFMLMVSGWHLDEALEEIIKFYQENTKQI